MALSFDLILSIHVEDTVLQQKGLKTSQSSSRQDRSFLVIEHKVWNCQIYFGSETRNTCLWLRLGVVSEVKGKVEIFQTYFSGKYDLTLTNEFLNKMKNGLAIDVWSKTLATRFLDYLG